MRQLSCLSRILSSFKQNVCWNLLRMLALIFASCHFSKTLKPREINVANIIAFHLSAKVSEEEKGYSFLLVLAAAFTTKLKSLFEMCIVPPIRAAPHFGLSGFLTHLNFR